MLAAEVIGTLDMPDIEGGFETQLSIIEAFDVRSTLVDEDGEKIIYIECKIGEAKLPCELSTTEL